MGKKILIVSYTFPPNEGIGGRRWAKFSKYLKKKENELYLLTQDLGIKSRNHQYSEFKGVEYFNSRYPVILNKIPSSFKDKIYYKLALMYVKLRSKGNYFDRSVFLEKEFLKKSGGIILTNKIDTVIITGAPFRLLYYGTLLKKKYNIKLLCDIRDPWTWGIGYGMSLLSIKRKEKELFFEKSVLKNADLITVPVNPMLDYLKLHYQSEVNKIKLLPHAFDADDFNVKGITKKTLSNNCFKLIYGGTIYRDLKREFESIYEFCKENDNLDFSIQIYTNKFQYLNGEKLTEISEKLTVKPYVSPSELMYEIKNANGYLLIFPDEVKDFISTKFYEIIQCRTPIIYIGKEGEVSHFITSNNLGIHIEKSDVKRHLLDVIYNKRIVDYNSNFPIEKYSFKSVTNILVEYLK